MENDPLNPENKPLGFCCLPACGMLGGVCAGVAYWFGLPTWLIRMALFLLIVCYGVGFLPYILLWIFVPNFVGIPSDYVRRTGG